MYDACSCQQFTIPLLCCPEALRSVLCRFPSVRVRSSHTKLAASMMSIMQTKGCKQIGPLGNRLAVSCNALAIPGFPWTKVVLV